MTSHHVWTEHPLRVRKPTFVEFWLPHFLCCLGNSQGSLNHTFLYEGDNKTALKDCCLDSIFLFRESLFQYAFPGSSLADKLSMKP